MHEKTKRSLRKNIVFLHLFIWCVVASLPVLMGLHSDLQLMEVPWFDWFRILMVAGVFYLNQEVLVPRLALKAKMAIFWLLQLPLAFLAFLVIGAVLPLIPRSQPMHLETGHLSPIAFFVGDTVVVYLTAGMALAIGLLQRSREEQVRVAELESENLRSELAMLKMQLSPHFLFNTLNNIYALIAVQQDKAQEAVHQLSRILRHLLYESEGERVPLAREVAFMESVIELMTLRLPKTVQVQSQFQMSDDGLLIAPLLFLPLIENVFKHAPRDGNGIVLEIHLQESQGSVVFRTRNPCLPPLEQKSGPGGIGIHNLQKRLKLLYPGRATYETEIVDNHFCATLTVHVRGN